MIKTKAKARSLQELRIACGLTQEEVAKVLGTSFPNVSLIERGLRGLSAERAAQLARIYGVKMDDINRLHKVSGDFRHK